MVMIEAVADYQRRKENERIADVLQRDAGHVDSLRAIAATIRSALGGVQASELEYQAHRCARDLVHALKALQDDLAEQSRDHRRKSVES